jgi:hypothetical protein
LDAQKLRMLLVARKLAMIMHHMWADETDFMEQGKAAA